MPVIWRSVLYLSRTLPTLGFHVILGAVLSVILGCSSTPSRSATPPPARTTSTSNTDALPSPLVSTVQPGPPGAPTNPEMGVSIRDGQTDRRRLGIWWYELDEITRSIGRFDETDPEQVQHWHVQVHRNGSLVCDDPEHPLIMASYHFACVDYVALQDGSWDIRGGVYQFRVAAVNGYGRGPWSVWSNPVEVSDPPPFVPQVASPFTAMELNFLNALLVAGFHEWLMVEPEGRVSADGIDLNGDGRTDVGWDSLDVLSRHTTAVRIGSDLCDPSTMFFFLATDSSFMDEHEREQFNVISRAYLC